MKDSHQKDLDSTTFLDNEFERNFGSDLFEQALFSSLNQKQKEQVLASKEQADNSKDFVDAINNPLQNWGSGTNDLTYKGTSFFSRRNLSWQIPKQDSIMRGIPYFDKASSWKATRALINGIDLSSKKHDFEELNEVKRALSNLFFPLHKIIKLGDFNGSSAGLMFFSDCIEDKDYLKPLNIKKIARGSFQGIRPLTRYYQYIPVLDGELVTRVDEEKGIYSADEIGQPMYYNVNISGDTEAKYKWFKVHRSRLLVYTSIELTWIEKKIELYGGPSLLERCYTDFARYESLIAQINKLAQRSNVPILNMRDLPKASLNNTHFIKTVMQKIKSINYSASSGNMILLGDKDNEQFKFETASFGEILGILKHERQNLAANLEAPTSVCFNETDDNDESIYLTKPKEIQDGKLRYWYNRLIPILYKNKYGKMIKDFNFKFKSLEFVSEKDKADRFKIVVETLHMLYEDEIVDVESYQAMLKVAMDDISDIPHEITENYIQYIAKKTTEDKENPLTKKRRDIEVAIALNQANAENNGGNTSNKVESAEKGKLEGGDQSKKKPIPKLPMNKGKGE